MSQNERESSVTNKFSAFEDSNNVVKLEIKKKSSKKEQQEHATTIERPEAAQDSVEKLKSAAAPTYQEHRPVAKASEAASENFDNRSDAAATIVPHNLEAERALLGGLLLNNNAMEHVSDFLRPEHFYYPPHCKIFYAMQTMIDKNQVADPITLKDFFNSDEELQSVGGAEYFVDLVSSVVSIANTYDYGQIIFDAFIRRQLICIAQETNDECMGIDIETTGVDIVENLEKKLYNIAMLGQGPNNTVTLFKHALSKAIESAESAFKRDSHLVGVTTGLLDVDRWLGGLHKSDLLIIAGRPSMGKTALATNIAFNAAREYLTKPKEGAKVAFFSLEMSSEQLAMRILASESGISSDKIRRGCIKREDFPKFVEVSRQISDLELFIDDTPGLSLPALRSRARRLKRQHDIGLVVIDYLQLIDAASRRTTDNRVQEVSTITRTLKTLAKELDVPIVALSQLSRAVEQRDDKRPQLADLRESGSIEQDADVVLFVYREEYYEARKEPKDGTDEHAQWQKKMNNIYNQSELIIAKQRHGPVGTIKLFFDGQLTKFGNADQNW
ncbi:MAG: replicative DNA helicase [Holosporales bacterium]|nr:replicative DNA helicase [Holosporales bacterium]